MWPENWPAFELFMACKTQWRTGMSGATGLDYLPVFSLLDRRGFTGDEWGQVFEDIRVMEAAALNALHDDK